MRHWQYRSYLFFCMLVMGSVLSPWAMAADGMRVLQGECNGCHSLEGPAPGTTQGIRERKGPDLHYAGHKYQAAWLKTWLQKPTRIRPAGMYYGNALVAGAKTDELDAGKLVSHPALSAEQAQAVTETLMTFKANSTLIKSGDYQPGTLSISMGEMMFIKFRGCIACHEIEPGYGGLSGPEVYSAAQRLQPDYLVSYLRNPQAWDPRIFMPNPHLSEQDIQKFVHYFRALSQESQP